MAAVFAISVLAQMSHAQQREVYQSRAEEIEAARKRKAAELKPEAVSGTEQAMIEFKERRILEKFTYGIGGLRAKIGGLVTGSGFAFGPEYFRDDLRDGNIVVRGTSQFSTRGFQLYDAELAFPKLANNHLFFSVQATHRNYPQLQYYGQGPDSAKTGRSNFRLEDTSGGFTAGIRPVRFVRVGGVGKVLKVNVGPGTDNRFISTDRQFGPGTTPGIDVQTDFLQAGLFGHIDYRDNPFGARSGGFYSAQFTYNKDTGIERHSFRKLDLEMQQFIPFFNQRRVIALRAKTELTYTNPGQRVPFYMQPTVGGSNDLRGFRPYRFYDDNSLVLNAEYRYEIFAGMDMAIFGDAGKVFHQRGDLNFHDLEGAYGVGMRFNARNAVFMRIDAGFSHEGFQVWVKFNNVF